MRRDKGKEMLDENTNRYKIEQMRQFYEIFPYPGRSFFITPYLGSQMSAHGAFAEMMNENQVLAAQTIFSKSLRARYKKNFNVKEILSEMEKVFPNTKKILLIGCGTDEPLLFRMLHPRHDIVCIDLSKKNIKIAKKKLFFHSLRSYFKFIRAKKGKTEFIVGDANVILKEKFIGQFDYIQCFGVLHHQPNPEVLLAGMAERLAVGGTLRMMIYSYYGRGLERKIQKKYNYVWQNISKINKFKLLIFYNFFLLRIWQFFNFMGLKKSTYLRFKYLGLNAKFVADAFMHPSDPGLCLDNILPMAEKYSLKLIYCQAKIESQGIVCGFQEPLQVWEKILDADKENNLVSNPVLIFTKVNS